MSVLNTRTKKVLVGAALGMVAWELLAVFGKEQFITDALVELALERVWIFWWIGAILGHLVLPRKPPRDLRAMNWDKRVETMTGRFILWGLVFVVAWELLLGFAGELVAPVVAINAAHLWISPAVGFVFGSRLWPRALHGGEL